MLFNSLDFFLFLLVVWLIQRALPHRPRNLFLLAASYFFYACWDWRFLSLIWISTIVDWYCGQAIHQSGDDRRRKLLVGVSVAINLGILGFFKYAGFFVESAESLLSSIGFSPETWRLDFILPVGISFYTFQTMSYSIDIYRGQARPARRFTDFALFVAFFPQLVAGPIERAKNLLPQFAKKTVPSAGMLKVGVWLIFWGLFKKVVIADNLAPIVDQAFGGGNVTAFEVLLGVYAFAFQIYCDFSGYSDIARGTAKLMGYDLMLNFRLPYFATNPSDFWRRWHISLSSWLRDYLYIPLGGNRQGKTKTYRNLMLTMLLGGLWHGAAWTFVLWGAYQGALLAVHRLIRDSGMFKGMRLEQSRIWWGFRVVVMFHLICMGWLIFRAESITQLGDMLHTLFAAWQPGEQAARWLWRISILVLPLFLVQILQGSRADTNAPLKMSTVPRGLLYTGTLLMMITLGSFGSQPFIYFQF